MWSVLSMVGWLIFMAQIQKRTCCARQETEVYSAKKYEKWKIVKKEIWMKEISHSDLRKSVREKKIK